MAHVRDTLQTAIQTRVNTAWPGASAYLNYAYNAEDDRLSSPWVNLAFSSEESELICKTPRYVKHTLNLAIEVYVDKDTTITGASETGADSVAFKALALISEVFAEDLTFGEISEKSGSPVDFIYEKDKEAETPIAKATQNYLIVYYTIEGSDEVAA